MLSDTWVVQTQANCNNYNPGLRITAADLITISLFCPSALLSAKQQRYGLHNLYFSSLTCPGGKKLYCDQTVNQKQSLVAGFNPLCADLLTSPTRAGLGIYNQHTSTFTF